MFQFFFFPNQVKSVILSTVFDKQLTNNRTGQFNLSLNPPALFKCIIMKQTGEPRGLWTNTLLSCWGPAATIWGILPTLHCYLGVNCLVPCEWIFEKYLLMTLYVLPPVLFPPRISHGFIGFFIGGRSAGRVVWLGSFPQRSAERSNRGRHRGLNTWWRL